MSSTVAVSVSLKCLVVSVSLKCLVVSVSLKCLVVSVSLKCLVVSVSLKCLVVSVSLKCLVVSVSLKCHQSCGITQRAARGTQDLCISLTVKSFAIHLYPVHHNKLFIPFCGNSGNPCYNVTLWKDQELSLFASAIVTANQ